MSTRPAYSLDDIRNELRAPHKTASTSSVSPSTTGTRPPSGSGRALWSAPIAVPDLENRPVNTEFDVASEIKSNIAVNMKAPSTVSSLPMGSMGDKKGKVLLSTSDQEAFAKICEEILGYSALLDASRMRAVEEAMRLKETVKELENLLDSARLREMEHLTHVERQRELLSQFEAKYYTMKNRAKEHIKDLQDEREKSIQLANEAEIRLRDVQNDLYSTQSVVAGQKAEIQRLKEASRNMMSERELSDLNLKLRKIESENSRLASEKARLQQQVNDLMKRLDTGAGPMNASKVELEETIKSLERQRLDMTHEYEDRIKQSQSESEKFKQYAIDLLTKLDTLEGAHNSRSNS